jgi:hypothetical protein
MKWLPAAEWWYNCAYHTSIKISPFEALYEYKPPLINQIAVPCNVPQNLKSPYWKRTICSRHYKTTCYRRRSA